MHIKVTWDDHHDDIILFEFPPVFNWDQYYVAEDQAHAMIEERGRDVGYIFDFPQNAKIPDNAISNGRRVIEQRHSKVTLVVNVGSTAFIRTLFNMGIRMYPTLRDNVAMSGTIDEAREMICERLQQNVLR